MSRRKYWYTVGLLLLLVVLSTACGSQQSSKPQEESLASDAYSLHTHTGQQPVSTMQIDIPRQLTIPTTTPTSKPASISAPRVKKSSPPAVVNPSSCSAKRLTTEETLLTQQLFALINSDRAARGLYPFAWNNTLACGALLHSLNMHTCGFNHISCPDGKTPCERTFSEGFSINCRECIGEAGPYPTPYGGVHSIQESMINEPSTGDHHITLTSTTMHQGGVGLYIDSSGSIWFTEDFVS